MTEKEGRKWHDSLTAIGTMIALLLGGVTFYYQFLRKPRELTAIVLRVQWNAEGSATVRIIIWNDGQHDEIVEAVNFFVKAVPWEEPEESGYLFGPEIIRAGEAKSFSAVIVLDQRRLTNSTLSHCWQLGSNVAKLLV